MPMRRHIMSIVADFQGLSNAPERSRTSTSPFSSQGPQPRAGLADISEPCVTCLGGPGPRATPPHAERYSSGRARHRALGELDRGPDVHVDDNADDLEDLLRAEVIGEGVVEVLECCVPVGVAARVSASV